MGEFTVFDIVQGVLIVGLFVGLAVGFWILWDSGHG